MKFLKMEAAGNDFVLLDARRMRLNWARLARAMCDRHLGIGSDGLLLVSPSSKADYRMRMFNPDGSEAESCGNGLRCFTKYLVDAGLVAARKKEIRIETGAGIRSAIPRVIKGNVNWAKVSMGKPTFKPNDIPVALEHTRCGTIADIKSVFNYPLLIKGNELTLSFVSMGNPHAVCFQEGKVSDFPLLEVGPEVEYHPIFPNRTNFEAVRIASRHRVEARVWERGAGETLACGSGASAIAVAGIVQHLVESPVDIVLPGGTLQVEWDGQSEVWLSGPVRTVFAGDWPERNHRADI